MHSRFLPPGRPWRHGGRAQSLRPDLDGDAEVGPERKVDPAGRDGTRAPLPWDGSPGHGWGPAEPWLPWPPEAATRNVETESAYAGSVLNLYRRVLAARRESDALRLGSWHPLPSPDGVFVYERVAGDDRRVVAINYADAPADVEIEGDLTVEVSSDGEGEGAPYKGGLAAEQAVLLRP